MTKKSENRPMTKIPFLFLIWPLFTSCMTLTRTPAGNVLPLQFNISGQSEPVSQDYHFQLLSLGDLLKNKVLFTDYKLEQPISSTSVHLWQEQLVQALVKIKENQGINLKFEQWKAEISVDQVEIIISLLQNIDLTKNATEIKLRQKIEVIEAFNENFRPPSEYHYNLISVPRKIFSLHTGALFPVTEVKDLNVQNSSVWQNRKAEDIDMFKGPGSVNFQDIERDVCKYVGPKRGYGVHAGFKIKCSGKKLKVKFGNETYSGPFNSRIYHRLGYNVPTIHYINALKVSYDRKLLSEINSRKSLYLELTVLGKKVYNNKNIEIFDATDLIDKAVLKDGKNLTRKEFKYKLIKSCKEKVCDYSDSNINIEFENSIDFITLIPSTIVDDPPGEELGSWSYSNLDHFDRPEIRSLAILGAWTGNFDLRKKNSSLYWNPETNEIKHFISDPGSGLGESFKAFKKSGRVDHMNWKAAFLIHQQEGFQSVPYMNISFSELEKNEAFQRLTYNDARWLVEQISKITEDEISEALAATNMSAAEFLLAREKLISLQINMIKSFNLKLNPSLIHRTINKRLNFNKDRDKVEITLRDGRHFRLENRGMELRNGQLLSTGPQNP